MNHFAKENKYSYCDGSNAGVTLTIPPAVATLDFSAYDWQRFVEEVHDRLTKEPFQIGRMRVDITPSVTVFHLHKRQVAMQTQELMAVICAYFLSNP